MFPHQPGADMRRREFVVGFGGSVALWPHAALSQQQAKLTIGFIGSDTPQLYADRLRAFRLGLKEAGYVEDQNIAVEYRWAEGRNDRLPSLMDDLIGRRVAVIVATTTPSTLAAKTATTAIPIVFFVAGDPVQLGIAASLNRPGGNLTGATTLTLEVGAKRLELLHQLVPTTNAIALLVNPTSPNLAEAQSRDLDGPARSLGLQVHVIHASTDVELDNVFANLGKLGVGGLMVSSDSFFFSRSERIASLAARYRMPAVYGFRESAVAGGLLSYGGSLADSHRWIGLYVGRILKGEKPAELPIQQSTKVELIVNLKAAKALGISVPISLLGRADEVIE
jgi:putative ABC transport system substrate-binding protein